MFGAEVACVMRSAAARGEFADFERATYGSKALSARCCSILNANVRLLSVFLDVCMFLKKRKDGGRRKEESLAGLLTAKK